MIDIRRDKPISADAVVAGRSLGSPQISPDGKDLCYSSTINGVSYLMVASVEQRYERHLMAVPVKGGYFGFGGRYKWSPDGSLIYAVASSSELVVVDLATGSVDPIFAGGEVSDLQPSPDGEGVLFVVDQSRILYQSTSAPKSPARTVVDLSSRPSGFANPDFLAAPVFSGDGRWIAWCEWSNPAMPWDAARIVMKEFTDVNSEVEIVFGSTAGDFTATQPKFHPDTSDLYCISDRTGYSLPWVIVSDGVVEPKVVFELDRDCAEPDLSPGQSSYELSGAGIFVAVNQDGFGNLSRVDPTGGLVEIRRGVFGGLHVVGSVGAALRTGARTPTQIVTFDLVDTELKTLAVGSPISVATKRAVEPEVVTIAFDQSELLRSHLLVPFDSLPSEASVEFTARLYRATSEDEVGVIVWLHGGPTGQTRVGANPRYEYFLDRGFSILVPDYRGSSGSGRSMIRSIYGHYGVSDTIDTAASLVWVREHLGYDERRSFLIGGSSSGATVLSVLRHFPGLNAGSVALYPVTDYLELARTTWRFEEHYFDSLVGPLPEYEEAYRVRSPISWATEISAPLLILQGLDDPVVPANLTQAFVDKVGSNCTYVTYPGQGHGWSSVAVVTDELKRIETFMAECLGSEL